MHLSTGPASIYKMLKSLLPCGRAADDEGEDGSTHAGTKNRIKILFRRLFLKCPLQCV